MQHVPYRGSAPAVTDLVAGRVPVMFAPIGTAKPFIEGGQLRAIAVTGLRRVDGLPTVPTIDEAGPARLRGERLERHCSPPPARRSRSSIACMSAVVKILASEETRRRLAQLDAIPRGTDPETFRRYVAADVARWIPVARETGTKAE